MSSKTSLVGSVVNRGLQHVGILSCTALFYWAFWKRRLMRGQHGTPDSLDKVSRFLFLMCLLGPSLRKYTAAATRHTWAAAAIAAYTCTFLDGSETHGGRTSVLADWLWQQTLQRVWRSKVQSLLVRADKGSIEANQQYVFAAHPHGVLPLGAISNLTSPGWDAVLPEVARHSIRVLVASFTFYLPGMREMYMGLGFVDAARFSAARVLESGKSMWVFPGGASEALYATPGSDDRLVLESRKGFVRLAIHHGVAGIVPVFTFGETDAFNASLEQGSGTWRFQQLLQKLIGLNFPAANELQVAHATTVVGPVLAVPHSFDPAPELVDRVHKQYMEAVAALYTQHAPKYNALNNRASKTLHFLPELQTRMP